jgi:beta-glucosidase
MPTFPKKFLWGLATSAHQVEGNNISSDMWVVERVKPTLYKEPSGDACNSFNLWPQDLDLVKELGFNTYRFSIEWARIEPEQGLFSVAMLDHYRRMVEGCRERGLNPVVTFQHFSLPRWVAAQGGWTNPESPKWFARYCERAAKHLASGLEYVSTLNEPNIVKILPRLLPPEAMKAIPLMNAAAGQACGSTNFKHGLIVELADVEKVEKHLLEAHRLGRAAIKAARGDLQVGVSLSLQDAQAVGENSIRDKMRAYFYGAWLEQAKGDDFIGIQNYTRTLYDDKGKVKPPEGAKINQLGLEIYPPSLAGATRYAHEATGRPVLVTEHGVNVETDEQRIEFTRDALREFQNVIADGVPVKGYIHWSLLDNFEWLFGYEHHYGVCAVDRKTFKRTPKASGRALGEIARRNQV